MPNTKNNLDFIVIGAQKAGTTSLFEYLRRHPELCLPRDKEAPYFSHDAVLARGWDRYISVTFASAEPTRSWGTITTHYMVGGVYDSSATTAEVVGRYDERTVPMRIRERLPDVRLIAVLRDPVERARSHHQMATMNGLEQRSFDEAIDDLLRPASLSDSRHCPNEATGYVAWGEYGRILTGYFDTFPREQILVVFTDELEHAPEKLMRKVHDFIGVSPSLVPDNLGTRYRKGATKRRLTWLNPSVVQRIVASNSMIRKLWHTLPRSTRLQIDRSFKHLVYTVDLWNQSKNTAVNVPRPETLARLRQHYEQDTERLAGLLGTYPPWHKRVGTV